MLELTRGLLQGLFPNGGFAVCPVVFFVAGGITYEGQPGIVARGWSALSMAVRRSSSSIGFRTSPKGSDSVAMSAAIRSELPVR